MFELTPSCDQLRLHPAQQHIAIRRNGYPGRLIEGVGPTSLYALLAECHQHRTSRTKLENLVAPRDAIRPLG